MKLSTLALAATLMVPATQAQTISTELRSRDVRAPGFVIGDGPVQWSSLSAAKDGVSFFIWSDYDLDSGAIREIDVGTSYTTPLTQRVSATAGAQLWFYPSGEFGENDVVANVGLTYNGDVNANVNTLTRLRHVDDLQTAIIASASKRYEAGPIGITPTVSGAYLHNFFESTGTSHITPGVTLDATIAGLEASAHANYQHGISQPSVAYGGIRLSKTF